MTLICFMKENSFLTFRGLATEVAINLQKIVNTYVSLLFMKSFGDLPKIFIPEVLPTLKF